MARVTAIARRGAYRRAWIFERTHGVDTPVDIHQFTGITMVRFAAAVRFNSGGQVLIRGIEDKALAEIAARWSGWLGRLELG